MEKYKLNRRHETACADFASRCSKERGMEVNMSYDFVTQWVLYTVKKEYVETSRW